MPRTARHYRTILREGSARKFLRMTKLKNAEIIGGQSWGVISEETGPYISLEMPQKHSGEVLADL